MERISAEVFENSVDTDLKIILLDQNVGNLKYDAKSFDIVAISLSTLHNYFEMFNKIIFISVSTIAKLLDSAKSSFLYNLNNVSKCDTYMYCN